MLTGFQWSGKGSFCSHVIAEADVQPTPTDLIAMPILLRTISYPCLTTHMTETMIYILLWLWYVSMDYMPTQCGLKMPLADRCRLDKLCSTYSDCGV
jgi:hypothetical protein